MDNVITELDLVNAGIIPPKQINPAETGNKVVMYRLSDVNPEQVKFLWKPYLPIGKITMMEGDPSGGKTFLALAIGAIITKGIPFPIGEDGETQKPLPQNVIYISGEDGIADTLLPRLDKVGADVSRVYAVSGLCDDDGRLIPWDMSKIKELADAIKNYNPALIVIDPVQAFLGENVDMHRANQVRPRLTALANMAEQNKLAVLIIRHLSKSTASKALYRGMGSIDFTAAARSVLLVGQDTNNENIRAMIQLKSSLAKKGIAQQFEITDEGINWLGVSEMTPDDVLGIEDTKEEKTAMEEAVDFLRDFLADGAKSNPDIDKAARRYDINSRTLRRAKEQLVKDGEIRKYKQPGERYSPWCYEQLDNTLDKVKLSSCQNLNNHGHSGQLDNSTTQKVVKLKNASNCKYCGKPIEWGTDEHGKWVPLESDLTGIHKCKERWVKE